MSSATYPTESGEVLFLERTLPVSKAVGINLVDNPRNIIQDAVIKEVAKGELSASLLFAQVTKYVYKVERQKQLIKNIAIENKYPTETPYPFGMMEASIGHTNFDLDLIIKDCEIYTKQEQAKVTKRIQNLVDYLNTSFSDRGIDDFIARKYAIDTAPASPENDALLSALLSEVSASEDTYWASQQILFDKISVELEQLKLKQENVLQEISKIYAEQADSNSNGLARIPLDYQWSQRELKAKNTLDELFNKTLELFYLREQIEYSVLGTFDLKQKYIVPSPPTEPAIDAQGNIREYEGIIPKLEDDLYFHTEWCKTKPQIRIVSVANSSQNYTPYVGKLWQQKFGTAGFWGCEMLTYRKSLSVIPGEYNRNLKDPDRIKIRFWDDESSILNNNEELSNHFLESISIPNKDELFVVFQLIKNKLPLNYRRDDGSLYYTSSTARAIDYSYDVIMSSKESKYLASYSLQSKLPLLFHPPIHIIAKGQENNLDYNEELMRNLYLDVEGTTKHISKLLTTKYKTKNKDKYIQNICKILYTEHKASSIDSQRYKYSKSIAARTAYIESNPNKIYKQGENTETLNTNISDVYFLQCISLNTRREHSCRYIFKFFEYLKSISKVTEKDFIAYQAAQTSNPDTNPRPYLLHNIFKVKNKLMEIVYNYSYISIENISDTWIALDDEYLNGIVRPHTKGFAMIKIVPKDKKKLNLHAYTQFNYSTLNKEKDFYGNTIAAWSYNVTPLNQLSYEESILEIYYQTEDYSYTKISVHGLKQIINRKAGYLELPEPTYLATQDVYSDSQFSYDIRKTFTDTSINYLSEQIYSTDNTLDIYEIPDEKDSSKDIKINATISNNLSSFIIPIWDHDISDDKYYDKDEMYNINSVESMYQDSLNLLVFVDLTKQQLNPTLDDKYWIPINLRDKALTAYLDKFISAYSLDQKEILYEYNYTEDNNYPLDTSYKDLMYHIGTAPNIAAYLPIPPNPFNSVYMIAQQRVSKTFSFQEMNHKSKFNFEKLSFENKTFGVHKTTKFKFK